MNKLPRRTFLRMCMIAGLGYPLYSAIASTEGLTVSRKRLPITVAVLKAAYISEMKAHIHYNAFCDTAVEDEYPNIAYLFRAFSFSEIIHAENYKRLLNELDTKPEEPGREIVVLNTKKNIQVASNNEMDKIDNVYPDFLKKLRVESYDQAVVNCMYSWKSHRQHLDDIKDIQRYSKLFFGSVAREIEGRKLHINVCEICGSTIDEPPEAPCEICNNPMNHYQEIVRPG